MQSKNNDIELPLLSEGQARKLNDLNKTKSNEKDQTIGPGKYRQKLSLFSFLTFNDMWSLLRRVNGKKGELKPDDLPLPFAFCNIEEKILVLDVAWTEELSKSKPSIVLAVVKAFKKEAYIMALLCFGLILIKLLSLPLMGDIISMMTQGNFDATKSLGAMLFSASLLSVCIVIVDVLNVWYWHYANVIAAI